MSIIPFMFLSPVISYNILRMVLQFCPPLLYSTLGITNLEILSLNIRYFTSYTSPKGWITRQLIHIFFRDQTKDLAISR